MGEAEGGAVNMYRQQGLTDQGRMSSHSGMQHASSAHGHPGHPGHPAHASHPAHVPHSTAHMGAMYPGGVYGSAAMQQQQQQAQAQVHVGHWFCTLTCTFCISRSF